MPFSFELLGKLTMQLIDELRGRRRIFVARSAKLDGGPHCSAVFGAGAEGFWTAITDERIDKSGYTSPSPL